VKNEMRDLAGGSFHFTTVYNFLQIQFCHVILLLGGEPKCNLQFLTLVIVRRDGNIPTPLGGRNEGGGTEM